MACMRLAAMFSPERVSISFKIYAAFGVMLTLLIANAIVNQIENRSSATLLERYVESSQKAEQSTEIKNSMEALIYELRYGMLDLSGGSKNRALTAAGQMKQRIAQLVSDTNAEAAAADASMTQFVADLTQLQKTFDEYLINFKKVLDLEERREKSAGSMYARGPEVFKRVAELSAYAYKTGNRSILDSIDGLLSELQYAQVDIYRFMRAPQKEASDAVGTHLRSAIATGGQIIGQTTDEEGSKLAHAVDTALNGYKKAFFEVGATTFVAQRIFSDAMEKQSASILSLSGALTRSQGERRQASVAAAERASARHRAVSLTLIGVFLTAGMLLAGLIARNVVGGVRGITRAMTRLAEGCQDTDIPKLSSQDEIGDMARALCVFKDNAQQMRMLEAQRLAEAGRMEAERKQTVLTLAEKFEANVKGIVDTVSASP